MGKEIPEDRLVLAGEMAESATCFKYQGRGSFKLDVFDKALFYNRKHDWVMHNIRR